MRDDIDEIMNFGAAEPGPAAPPGPVRAGRRRIRGFLENSEKFFEFF